MKEILPCPLPRCGGDVKAYTTISGRSLVICTAESCSYSIEGETEDAASAAHNEIAAAVRDHATLSVENKRLREQVAQLREALTTALDYYERGVCHHENTHRGGAIWTICDDCGRRWADDRGGFTPYEEPLKITAAWHALAATAPKEADRG